MICIIPALIKDWNTIGADLRDRLFLATTYVSLKAPICEEELLIYEYHLTIGNSELYS